MAWTVYEARNEELKELYIVSTMLDVAEEINRNRERPPLAIAHWTPEARHSLTVLDVFPDQAAAAAGMRRRLARAETGWRVITDLHARALIPAPLPHGGRGKS